MCKIRGWDFRPIIPLRDQQSVYYNTIVGDPLCAGRRLNCHEKTLDTIYYYILLHVISNGEGVLSECALSGMYSLVLGHTQS